jgi:glycosyltransferase involved in cell wall biosynthesis
LWRRERAVVLPSGVDPDLFSPAPKRYARARLHWSQTDEIILFNSGNGAPVKRRDLAEAVMACAKRLRTALRLEVMDGRCSPDLVPMMMNAADCLLVTSDFEGSPTIVQEALACNLPVVSVDVGDVAQRLRGVRATRIAPRDPQALAQALDAVLSLGERSDGRLKLDECSSRRVAAELESIYRCLAGTKTALRASEQTLYRVSRAAD